MADGRSAVASRRAQILLAAVILVADQAAKAWVESEAFRPRTVIDGFFDLVRAHNTGVAFSLLADLPGGALIGGALALIGLMSWWWARTREPVEQWALAAILAGALGNLIDRARLGYVVDFVDWHVGDWHWPAFNLADAAITLGAIALAVVGLRRR